MNTLQRLVLLRLWQVHVQVLDDYERSLFDLELAYHVLNVLRAYFLGYYAQ